MRLTRRVALLNAFAYLALVPVAKPRSPPEEPAPLSALEADVIRRCVRKYYGEGAIIRNYGADPNRLQLHVEVRSAPSQVRDECLGLLMCEINRDYIGLDVYQTR